MSLSKSNRHVSADRVHQHQICHNSRGVERAPFLGNKQRDSTCSTISKLEHLNAPAAWEGGFYYARLLLQSRTWRESQRSAGCESLTREQGAAVCPVRAHKGPSQSPNRTACWQGQTCPLMQHRCQATASKRAGLHDTLSWGNGSFGMSTGCSTSSIRTRSSMIKNDKSRTLRICLRRFQKTLAFVPYRASIKPVHLAVQTLGTNGTGVRPI